MVRLLGRQQGLCLQSSGGPELFPGSEWFHRLDCVVSIVIGKFGGYDSTRFAGGARLRDWLGTRFLEFIHSYVDERKVESWFDVQHGLIQLIRRQRNMMTVAPLLTIILLSSVGRARH